MDTNGDGMLDERELEEGMQDFMELFQMQNLDI